METDDSSNLWKSEREESQYKGEAEGEEKEEHLLDLMLYLVLTI